MKLINYTGNKSKKGIYQIGFETHDKVYIGSTSYIRKRKEYHLRHLNAGTHPSPYLQHVYNIHKDSCYFEVIEVTDDLFNREQWYLDNYNNLLNICTVAGKPPGPNDYTKVSASLKKYYANKNEGLYLEIKELIEQGLGAREIVKQKQCSTKTVSKVRKMFDLDYDNKTLSIKSIKAIKRYFKFIKFKELRRGLKAQVYTKLAQKYQCSKDILKDIARNKIYKNI